MDPQTSKPEDDYFGIRLPGTEIPKWLNLNHESDGNVISFWVGRTFPNIFYVCFAFGRVKYPLTSLCYVDLSINGRKKKNIRSAYLYELSDNLWIFSLSNNELQNQLNGSNPSELNYVEVICEMEDWVKNHPRRWGVGVECICQWASNNGGGSRHQCRQRRRNHRPTYARRPQKHYLSHFGWLRIRFRLWKRSSRPTRIPTATLMSRYFLLFYYSLSLFGKPKKKKQTSFFGKLNPNSSFFFFGKLKGSEGNGRDRSQGFQQWSRRFRAFNRPHLC